MKASAKSVYSKEPLSDLDVQASLDRVNKKLKTYSSLADVTEYEEFLKVLADLKKSSVEESSDDGDFQKQLEAALSYSKIVLPFQGKFINNPLDQQLSADLSMFVGPLPATKVESRNVFANVFRSFLGLTTPIRTRVKAGRIVAEILIANFGAGFVSALCLELIKKVTPNYDKEEISILLSADVPPSDFVYITYHPREKPSDTDTNRLIILSAVLEQDRSALLAIKKEVAGEALASLPILLMASQHTSLNEIGAKALRALLDTEVAGGLAQSLLRESADLIAVYHQVSFQSGRGKMKRLKHYIKAMGGFNLGLPMAVLEQCLSLPARTLSASAQLLNNTWDVVWTIFSASSPSGVLLQRMVGVLANLLTFKETREPKPRMLALIRYLLDASRFGHRRPKRSAIQFLYVSNVSGSASLSIIRHVTHTRRVTAPTGGEITLSSHDESEGTIFDTDTISYVDVREMISITNTIDRRKMVESSQRTVVRSRVRSKRQYARIALDNLLAVTKDLLGEMWPDCHDILSEYMPKSPERYQVLRLFSKYLDRRYFAAAAEHSFLSLVFPIDDDDSEFSQDFCRTLVEMSNKAPSHILDGIVYKYIIPRIHQPGGQKDPHLLLRLVSKFNFMSREALLEFANDVLIKFLHPKNSLSKDVRASLVYALKNVVPVGDQRGVSFWAVAVPRILKIALFEDDPRTRFELVKMATSCSSVFHSGLMNLDLFLEDKHYPIAEHVYKFIGKLSSMANSEAQTVIRKRLNRILESLWSDSYDRSTPNYRRLLLTNIKILSVIFRYSDPSVACCHKNTLLDTLGIIFGSFSSYSGCFNKELLECVKSLVKSCSSGKESVVTLDITQKVAESIVCNYKKSQTTFCELRTSLSTLKTLVRELKLVIIIYYFQPELYEVLKELTSNFPPLELYAADLLSTIGAIDPREILQISNYARKEGRFFPISPRQAEGQERDDGKSDSKLLQKLRKHESTRKITKFALDFRFSYPPTITMLSHYTKIKSLQAIIKVLESSAQYEVKIPFAQKLRQLIQAAWKRGEEKKESHMPRLAFPHIVRSVKKLLGQTNASGAEKRGSAAVITLVSIYLEALIHLIRISKSVTGAYFHKILRVVAMCWDFPDLVPGSVSVLREICSFEDFSDDVARVVFPVFLPEMANILQNSDNVEFGDSILTILEILDITDISDTYSDLIIPPLLKLLAKVLAPMGRCALSDLEVGVRIIKILFQMAMTKDIFKQLFIILKYLLNIEGSFQLTSGREDVLQMFYYFFELLVVRFPMPEFLRPYLEMLIQSNNLDQNSKLCGVLLSQPEKSIEEISKNFMRVYSRFSARFPQTDDEDSSTIEQHNADFEKIIDALDRPDSMAWNPWMNHIKSVTLDNSPELPLRICGQVLHLERKAVGSLFPLAFFTVWRAMSDQQRGRVTRKIRRNVFGPDTPRDIVVDFLDLINFVEICDPDSKMEFGNGELFTIAERCKAYGKALRYKELDYKESFSNDKIGDLIRINSKLMLKDSAKGLLSIAQKDRSFRVSVEWLEELGEWKKVLNIYNEMPATFQINKKRLDVCRILGDWQQLNSIIEGMWDDLSDDERVQVSDKAVRGAWFVKDLPKLTKYIKYIPDDMNGNFLRGIYNILVGDYKEAKKNINKTKQLVVGEFKSLVQSKMVQKTIQAGSYESYAMLVGLHQLGELEEIIKYRKGKFGLDDIKILWQRRLFGTHQSISVWQDILSVHSILFSGVDHSTVYSKYIKICYNNGNRDLSNYTLWHLVKEAGYTVKGIPSHFYVDRGNEGNFQELIRQHPAVYYYYLKYKFLDGDRQEAIQGLQYLIKNSDRKSYTADFLGRINLKYAKWTLKEFDNLQEYNIRVSDIEERIAEAAEIGRDWEKPYRLYSEFYLRTADMDPSTRSTRLKHAILHMINHISYTTDDVSIHDLLKLLTTWFNHYELDKVFDAFQKEYRKIPIRAWIKVTTQLLSRLNHHEGRVKLLLKEILSVVAVSYPQALVFPVTVARSNRDHQNNINPAARRHNDARDILEEMRKEYPKLVNSAEIVAIELLRVSILWQEIWKDGLDEFKYLFKCMDYEGLKATISSLYGMVKKGGETRLERLFLENYGKNIELGYGYISRIIGSKVSVAQQKQYIKKSWRYFRVVHKKVRDDLLKMRSFLLDEASERLKDIGPDSELAVPGTYKPGKPVIYIKSFENYVEIVWSKQRPRKIRINASNGEVFQYLLKGHEDLRQDERVMQVVDLINNLMGSNPRLKRLKIQRIPVIPLSFNSGLIGWLRDSKTLHRLVLERREWKGSSISAENNRIKTLWDRYDELTRIAKVEVMNQGMMAEDGNDIADVLWIKSKKNEDWISKREVYTTSLATMSMVGYILGLGDRHPNNLMITESTGKISHIDFGDCFEVAMEREHLPEKVPFRLTRMLIHGMGVPGERGTYQRTSERVMKILRKNREQISTILEAHVYDPLFQWVFDRKDRLVHEGVERKIVNPTGKKKRAIRDGAGGSRTERKNEKAMKILERVKDKLSGNDFGDQKTLTVKEQVKKLIEQASDYYNISSHYLGWCPFW